jgi:Na+-translocating ferredoxin:NAD+ oxidoreductase RNF subunit RnfB
MLHIYDRIIAGEGTDGDIELIERLAAGMQLGSLCELGKSAPNPVLSTLKYFRSEYEAHIKDHACPAGICREITAFEIMPDCDGCHACPKVCPTDAIAGTKKELHVIDHEACISCGACLDVCPTDSIRTFPKIELAAEEVV